jgi:hypothetical protein
MDRWEDRDGDDLGDGDDNAPARKRLGIPGLRSVTRHGLSGFVTTKVLEPAAPPMCAPESKVTIVMPSKQVKRAE